jgi:DNA-binding NtrC family response regulator
MKPRATILVVDDEELNRDIVKRVFGAHHDLVEAGHGLAARDVLEQRTIDVIISDHLMPGMNGAELARVVHERWPHTVFLLITGYDDEPQVVAAVAAGAIFQVVAKPWQIAQLRAAVDTALAERKRRQTA